MKFLGLLLKNIGRNKLRTLFTGMGTAVLVLVVTMIWSILLFIDGVMQDKNSNLKAIITERWQIPSQMPYTYADSLSRGGAQGNEPVNPKLMDSMTWQFFGGTLDPTKPSFENRLFAFCMEPIKIGSMMDELEDLRGARRQELDHAIDCMNKNIQGIVVGSEKLKQMNKRVGERIVLHGLNYRDIKLELEIVATLPEGTRYGTSVFINREYLMNSLEQYKRQTGKEHPMYRKTLNLVWLKVKDKDAFEQIASKVMSSPQYSETPVKAETQSAGISNFLEAYKDLLNGMRWLLAPTVFVILSMVIAIAISIGVRERQMEFAVMKVLGFPPTYILTLVLSEALLMAVIFSAASAGLTYYVINDVFEGLNFQIAFFGRFFVQPSAVVWGILAGAGAACIGSIIPAWTASQVKVAQVFSRVT